MKNDILHIGTCSWKYPSWEGLVYSKKKLENYLLEYSRHFNTVEVDQWFWSLFDGDKVVLPKPAVVREYAQSVPDGFTFSIKVPNSITLTHYYKKHKTDPLIPNPHFLSVDLMERFLESLVPLLGKTGPLVFQFEYLNKQKIRGVAEFIDLFGEFSRRLPKEYVYCVETRNPNYLNKRYFEFLRNQDLKHVFLQGYYMPSIFDIYAKFGGLIEDKVIIRLHGTDRKGIEEQTKGDWSQVVTPRDHELQMLVDMVVELQSRQVETFIFVNNHFEGSAPRTITKVKELLP